MNPTKHSTPLFRCCIDGQTAGAVTHASAVVLVAANRVTLN
jgi:hypothetical protein